MQNATGLTGRAPARNNPNLINIGDRLDKKQLLAIIKTGRGRMPSFQHIPDKDKNALVGFLLDKELKSSAKNKADSPLVKNKENVFPYQPPYILKNGLNRFFDPNGYPAIKPPWGTLNAIDLNTGEYLWKESQLVSLFKLLHKSSSPCSLK